MVEASSFVPMGQYDECSVFIDGMFARKRKFGQGPDYDIVTDDTEKVIREVQKSLVFMDTTPSVALNVFGEGGERAVKIDKAHAPYPRRRAKIENMCGFFSEQVHKERMRGACVYTSTVFGMNHELYHTEGNVTIVQGKAFFKGCRYVCFISHGLRVPSVLYFPSSSRRTTSSYLPSSMSCSTFLSPSASSLKFL